MGDDLLDLPVLRARRVLRGAGRCRRRSPRARALGQHALAGGRGAVRELIELVLRAQDAGTASCVEYAARR